MLSRNKLPLILVGAVLALLAGACGSSASNDGPFGETIQTSLLKQIDRGLGNSSWQAATSANCKGWSVGVDLGSFKRSDFLSTQKSEFFQCVVDIATSDRSYQAEYEVNVSKDGNWDAKLGPMGNTSNMPAAFFDPSVPTPPSHLSGLVSH
jgi:hypothetical protein